jgi:ABC-2 type transport system ATP-binding protein
VKDLVKTYPKVRAVDGISLNIKEGEVFGLLGPNGAGKTTTIRILLTLIKPTSGSVKVFGINALAYPGKVRELAGYIPQDISVDGELTGYENMLLYAKLYAVPRKTRKALISEAIEYMGLSDRANELVSKYSGGMMRRLEIAQTLVNRPKILYLDEPSIGLDPSARVTIWEHVEKLRREFGTTILLTTHDMNEADRLCHRIGIMNQGQLVTVGEPEQLKEAVGGDIISIGCDAKDCSAKLEALGYSVVSHSSNGLVDLVVNDGERQIPAILENLRSRGVAVNTISLKKPTLDDVFLSYTGSRIEQENAFAKVRQMRRTFRRLS